MTQGNINFNWGEPVIGKDSEGESIILLPADTLKRGKYAKFLHNYLVDNSSQRGYVLNLNAQWGAGKTYFINRWIDSIKDAHPVVYIDAWKQDYSDDPMLTVVSSIIDALEEHLPAGNKKAIALKNKATRFFKAAAPLLMKGLIKKATGMNIDDVEPETEKKEGSDLYNLTGEASAALAKCLIDDHNEKLKTVEHLRSDIKSLIEALDPKKKLKLPAFIFIDELDRCRPSYAVEMLEVIKHFFELENIVFVVATDTEQLQHAVKAVYGEGFDAQTYLGRFFRRRYSLSESSRFEFVKQMVGESYEIKSTWKRHTPSIMEGGNLWNLVSIVAGRFNLSLRETEQLADKFLAILSSEPKSMNPYLLLILFALRDKYYGLYECWVKHGDIYAYLEEGVRKAGLERISLPFHSSDGHHFVAIDSDGTFSIKLLNILNLMHKYCTIKSHGEKMKIDNELIEHQCNSNDADTASHGFLQRRYLNLEATKKDYVEWVEYAVSFDE
ncbi:TPA: KAP family NTPase [Vibrio parahaemolyticus]|nr:KAP family NTPase [Vibrio parahaemolyticus]HCE2615454.1 KAP family NTPase [Vibrio parahaemolyticus]HCE2636697.1 KAP family NTPase [Vibrio parahaemolyticus]HCE2714281.1 KAP family NTPase [Vibrio parahaemolyticus]HCE2719622.1 KAP family NTPase [Vibrio parahaemolyticus]